jgi:hypothetical protein
VKKDGESFIALAPGDVLKHFWEKFLEEYFKINLVLSQIFILPRKVPLFFPSHPNVSL